MNCLQTTFTNMGAVSLESSELIKIHLYDSHYLIYLKYEESFVLPLTLLHHSATYTTQYRGSIPGIHMPKKLFRASYADGLKSFSSFINWLKISCTRDERISTINTWCRESYVHSLQMRQMDANTMKIRCKGDANTIQTRCTGDATAMKILWKYDENTIQWRGYDDATTMHIIWQLMKIQDDANTITVRSK